MSKAPPSRTADKFIVRLPDGMRDRLAALARVNGRSTTAEIVAALESWLRDAETEVYLPKDPPPPGALEAAVATMSKAFSDAIMADPKLRDWMKLAAPLLPAESTAEADRPANDVLPKDSPQWREG